ncbi:MAG: transposase [Trueperaceae bacterium]
MVAGGGGSKGRVVHVGRPPKLSEEQVEELVALVRERPMLSLDDLVDALRRKSGVTISVVTARKYLREVGCVRARPPRAAADGGGEAATFKPQEEADEERVTSRSYGCHAGHRDVGDAVRYPCGLTDAEWAAVVHIFDPRGRTGRPPKYPRRVMLDACVYVLRFGCSWRMLPKDLPPWPVVYRTFRRWLAKGWFEQMYDELRMLWCRHERRNPDPSAAILDSQSVKTRAQGGP